jgi:hypothetical protein
MFFVLGFAYPNISMTGRFRRFCFFHAVKERVPIKHDIAFFCLFHLRSKYLPVYLAELC